MLRWLNTKIILMNINKTWENSYGTNYWTLLVLDKKSEFCSENLAQKFILVFRFYEKKKKYMKEYVVKYHSS